VANPEQKNVNTPDETRKFDKGKVEVVQIGGGTVGRATFEPGWKWSEHVKPIAKTDLCQASHVGYTISGRAVIRFSDGVEVETGPGDVFVAPPGHDAWVVGNEPWVSVDWAGMADYAKPK
jgi:uncharacterized RmlC-like cupin family protein